MILPFTNYFTLMVFSVLNVRNKSATLHTVVPSVSIELVGSGVRVGAERVRVRAVCESTDNVSRVCDVMRVRAAV